MLSIFFPFDQLLNEHTQEFVIVIAIVLVLKKFLPLSPAASIHELKAVVVLVIPPVVELVVLAVGLVKLSQKVYVFQLFLLLLSCPKTFFL